MSQQFLDKCVKKIWFSRQQVIVSTFLVVLFKTKNAGFPVFITIQAILFYPKYFVEIRKYFFSVQTILDVLGETIRLPIRLTPWKS